LIFSICQIFPLFDLSGDPGRYQQNFHIFKNECRKLLFLKNQRKNRLFLKISLLIFKNGVFPLDIFKNHFCNYTAFLKITFRSLTFAVFKNMLVLFRRFQKHKTTWKFSMFSKTNCKNSLFLKTSLFHYHVFKNVIFLYSVFKNRIF